MFPAVQSWVCPKDHSVSQETAVATRAQRRRPRSEVSPSARKAGRLSTDAVGPTSEPKKMKIDAMTFKSAKHQPLQGAADSSPVRRASVAQLLRHAGS